MILYYLPDFPCIYSGVVLLLYHNKIIFKLAFLRLINT